MSKRDFLSIESITAGELSSLLDRAADMKAKRMPSELTICGTTGRTPRARSRLIRPHSSAVPVLLRWRT